MQEGTFQTGSDIASNPGNAALGYGGNGVAYNGGGGNVLAGIDDTFRQLQQQDAQWNMMRYHQKMQDRDQIHKMIAEGTDFTGNTPNGARGPNGEQLSFGLLDPDRELLHTKANEIKEVVVKHPNIQTDREKYTDLQGKINDFQRLRFNAQARAIEAARQRHDMVAEQDEEERTKRKEHLSAELENGIEHVPFPYMKPLSYDDNLLSPEVKAEANGQPRFEQDAQGMWHQVETVATPLTGFNNSGKYVPGNPYFTNANNKYQRAVGSQTFMNKDNIEVMNKRIAEVNEKEGLAPGAPNYIQPIANIGEDGNITPNTNVPEFIRSLHFAQRYKNYDEDKLSKDAQGMQKTLAQQKKEEAITKKELSTAALNYAKMPVQTALADKYSAEADLARRKGDKIGQDEADAKKDALAPITQAYGIYDKYLGELKFHTAKDLSVNMKGPEHKRFNEWLGEQTDAEIAIVPSRNEAILSILSKPDYGEGAKQGVGAKAPDGKFKGLIKPKYVYMVKPGDAEDARFVGVFQNGDILSVDRSEAVDRLIDYKGKFSGGAEMVRLKNASHAVMNDYQSSIAPASGGAAPSPAAASAPVGAVSIRYVPGETKSRAAKGGGVEVLDPDSGKWRKLVGRDENDNLTLE